MKGSIFGDITQYIPVALKWNFGGIYGLQFQGWRESQTRNEHEADSNADFLLGLLMELEYGFTFQKAEIFNQRLFLKQLTN
jgi:hypothetical protein